MANFRDEPGTPLAKSISSCSVRLSFSAYVGRLYFATSVSMVTSAVAYAFLEMDSSTTRENGYAAEEDVGPVVGGLRRLETSGLSKGTMRSTG